jgi:hypothetical protein
VKNFSSVSQRNFGFLTIGEANKKKVPLTFSALENTERFNMKFCKNGHISGP